jgi:hypothetical protein
MDITATTDTNTATKIIDSGFDINLLLGEAAAPAEKNFTVSVLFDDDGNHKAGFEIVSKNSEQYRDVIRATSVTAIKRAQTKKQQIDGKTDAGANTLFELGENRGRKIAMAVVVGLPGFVDKGQPVPVSEQFLNAVFDKFPTWEEKILAALESDANFLVI